MDAQRKENSPVDHRLLYVWLPLGLVLLVAHAAYALWRVNSGHSDFLCFHHTSRHWLATGEFTQAYGVRHYLPAFAVLITPLAAWPLRVAIVLWTLLNGALLVLSVREAGRQSSRELGAALPPALFWVWPVFLVLPFASGTITLGQVNILVLWLCVWAYGQLVPIRPSEVGEIYLENGRHGGRPLQMRGAAPSSRQELKAGLAIAAAGIIKLYPLLLIVPLLLKKRYKAAAWAVVIFVLLAGGLSLAAFGWRGSVEAHRQWLAEVRGGDASEGQLIFRDEPSEFFRQNNQSLAVVVRRLTTYVDTGREKTDPLLKLTLPQARAVYVLLAGGILAGLTWPTWRRRKQPLSLFEWSAWLASVIALVPIYWTHYFVLLLPALTLVGACVWQSRRQNRGDRVAAGLQAAWLLGLPLLAFGPARWVGLHCWLAVGVALWCVRRESDLADRCRLQI